MSQKPRLWILPAIPLTLALLAAQVASPEARQRVSFHEKGEPAALAPKIVDSLTDEETLAQLFMIAYPGETPPEHVLKWARDRGLGGIKIFGWNAERIEPVVAAVNALQGAASSSPSGIPLFVATDQEGGWIRHVKGTTTETPGNMAIGASGFPRDAFLTGKYIARELAALGINMNFAPTVDLATDRDSRIIGSRAFSSDPGVTAALAIAYYKGMESEGIVCTAKHFPGHGDTPLDSHGTLPRVDVDLATAWDRELVPYRALAAEGIPAIMSGHLSFPKIVRNGTPASLSRYFLDDILRKRMGFRGLVITDDLYMGGAIQSTGSIQATVLRAIEAGNDIVMISRAPALDDAVWTSALRAYRSDPAFKRRVRESAVRIVEAKLVHLRSGKVPLRPDLEEAKKRVPDPEAAAFFFAQACRGTTWIRKGNLPIDAGKAGRVVLAGQFQEFFAAGRAAFPGAKTMRLSYLPWEDALAGELAAVAAAARDADTVIVCVPSPAAREALDAAARASKAKVYAVSVLTPSPLTGESLSAGSLAVYGYSPESFRAAFLALTGAFEPDGVLPLALD